MGNCIESCRDNQGRGEEIEKEIEENRGMGDGDEQNLKVVGEKNNGNSGVRVKMVLTKEELQWLMLQLSNREAGGNYNNKRIEEVLVEIENARKRVFGQSWKPSLSSISEVPELQEMHRLGIR
uniref:Uncharacterized protein n=1 Tax=Opuntia streptacantha TaxID=393608 RepID=A0A7C8YSM0_OPUST